MITDQSVRIDAAYFREHFVCVWPNEIPVSESLYALVFAEFNDRKAVGLHDPSLSADDVRERINDTLSVDDMVEAWPNDVERSPQLETLIRAKYCHRQRIGMHSVALPAASVKRLWLLISNDLLPKHRTATARGVTGWNAGNIGISIDCEGETLRFKLPVRDALFLAHGILDQSAGLAGMSSEDKSSNSPDNG